MAEKTVAVRLAARVDQYVAAMKAAQASTTGFATTTERNLTRVGSQMQNVGKKMTTFVSLPIAAAGAFAVKAAVDWESAWAGVTKTVDGTAEEMSQLEQGLRDMTKEVSASHGEIAAVAEAAGALGVASGDILGFTRVMIDLGETTNLTSDEAATAIAQMMNVMQTSADDVDNLGAALVHLGNNGASTEAEILQMATRIASAGAVVGLTEADVLGFANALSSMGIQAEAGGTAFSRVIQKIGVAVDTGGESLDAFAEIAGVAASDFATAFRDDPADAILMFTEGLGRIHESGGNLTSVLDDLGLSEIRVSDLLRRMAISGDLARESVDMASTSFAENSALTEEAGKRYATTAAQFEMVRNKIVDLFIDLGGIILPAVMAIVDAVGVLAEAFQGLPQPVQMVVGGFLALVAAAGPAIFLAGSLVKNWTAVSTAFTTLSGTAQKASLALGAIGLAVMAGYLAYQSFTAEQKELDARTKEVAEALGEQSGKVLDLAAAAGTATSELDGLTAANQALGFALANTGVDGLKLQQSFGTLGLSLQDVVFWMDALQGSTAQRGSALEEIARQAGVAEEELFVLADVVERVDQNGMLGAEMWASYQEQLGYTSEEATEVTQRLMPIALAMEEIDDQSQKFDGNAATRQFLQMAAGANDAAEEFISMAEEQTNLSRNGEHTRSVMAKLLEIVEALPPAEEAAARAALGLDGAQTDLAASAEAATAALEETNNQALQLGEGFGALRDAASESLFVDPWEKATVTIEELRNGVKGLRDEMGLWSEAYDPSSFVRTLDREKAAFGYMSDLFGQIGDDARRSADGIDDLTDSVEDLMSSFENIMSPAADLRAAERAVYEVNEELIASIQQANEDGIEMADMFNIGTETGRKHQAMLEDGQAAIYEHATALMTNGASAEEAAGHVAFNTGNLLNNIDAATDGKVAIGALNDEYFATPEEVATQLKMIGEAQAAESVGRHQSRLREIPSERTTHINVTTRGAYDAEATLNHIARNRNSSVSVSVFERRVTTRRDPNRAMGGYANRPEFALWGEAGAEAMFPLTRPARIRQLWDDPRISGPMMAALRGNLTPAPALAPAASTTTIERSDLPPIYVYNNGREITPDDIARAIRKSRNS